MYRREQGQSLVELAVSLALLLLIMLGIFDLGRLFNAYVVITNAAREGAYYAGMYPGDAGGIVARVLQEAQGSGIPLTAAGVTISGSGADGTPIQVTVRYNFTLLTSFLPVPSTIPLQRTATMVVY